MTKSLVSENNINERQMEKGAINKLENYKEIGKTRDKVILIITL